MKNISMGDHDDAYAIAKPTGNEGRHWMAMTDDSNSAVSSALRSCRNRFKKPMRRKQYNINPDKLPRKMAKSVERSEARSPYLFKSKRPFAFGSLIQANVGKAIANNMYWLEFTQADCLLPSHCGHRTIMS